MDLKLADVLQFMSSSETFPSLDFSGTLNFNEENPYPTTSTCALVLTLPTRYTSYEEFKEAFLYGMKNHGGFGLE